MDQDVMERAVRRMRGAGVEVIRERGEFNFGEWAGETERDMIEAVTGLCYAELTDDEVDDLCDAFLGLG